MNKTDKLARERNYQIAREKIEDLIEKPLTQEIINEIHVAAAIEGEPLGYRNGFIWQPIENPLTGETRYHTPNSGTHSMKGLMAELLNYMDGIESSIEKAAQLHWGLVKIHPFDNGNGRTARLLVVLILRKHGYSDLVCKRLEHYFETNRREYDDSLDDGKLTYSGFKEVSHHFINYLRHGLEISEKHVQDNRILSVEQTI